MVLRLYKSYMFRNKDPIIDRMRTAWQNAKQADVGLRKGGYAEVARRSNMSAATPANWFEKDTLRPQFASCAAFVRSIGYDLALVRVEGRRVHEFMPVKSRGFIRPRASAAFTNDRSLVKRSKRR